MGLVKRYGHNEDWENDKEDLHWLVFVICQSYKTWLNKICQQDEASFYGQVIGLWVLKKEAMVCVKLKDLILHHSLLGGYLKGNDSCI